MKKLFIIFILISSSLFATAKDEVIVTIHGFLGASWNMYFLNKNFKKHGWEVYSWQYSSRDQLIEEHGKDLVKELKKIALKNPNKKISFVAHSLGSLVLRSALNDPTCPSSAKNGKVVLITPPNNGSSFGRYLNKYNLFRKFAKSGAGKELFTKNDFDYLGSFPKDTDVLVLAGNLGFNPILEKENDGTVGLSETKLKTPHKHIVIKRGHKTIIFSKKTFNIALDFLNGRI